MVEVVARFSVVFIKHVNLWTSDGPIAFFLSSCPFWDRCGIVSRWVFLHWETCCVALRWAWDVHCVTGSVALDVASKLFVSLLLPLLLESVQWADFLLTLLCSILCVGVSDMWHTLALSLSVSVLCDTHSSSQIVNVMWHTLALRLSVSMLCDTHISSQIVSVNVMWHTH